jgi:hypothetical protein
MRLYELLHPNEADAIAAAGRRLRGLLLSRFRAAGQRRQSKDENESARGLRR